MNILFVDDEPMVRKALTEFIEEQLGHHVTACENGAKAKELYDSRSFPMVMTDIRMPGLDGIDLLRYIKEEKGDPTDVVLITAHSDVNTAIQALRLGAYDYLRKPINIDLLSVAIERIAEHQQLLHENVELNTRFEEKVARATERERTEYERLKNAYAEIVGIGRIGVFSETFRKLVELAEKYHRDRSVPVLIEGETGTGKEILARLVHYGKGEVTEPFISLNCSAISPSLFESELFGYEGGAFTGAKKEGMAGKLEMADGGTLFLDEIGDLPLEMQPKILRTLQESEFYRVGGVKKRTVDARIICATNHDLETLVDDKQFRKDLYYRLNLGRITIPPLRDRKSEIGPLAQMFLEHYAAEKKRSFRLLTKEAAELLENHDWPGNIRELKNAIERVVLLYDDVELKADYLRFIVTGEMAEQPVPGTPFDPESITLPEDGLDLQEVEKTIIRKALDKFGGNKTHTASYLGMTRSTLRSRLRKMD